jgi:D-galacturonate reductase
MNVLVLGAGMYVTGRGGRANGTILSSLAEASKTISLGKVVIAARRKENRTVVQEASIKINSRLGSNLPVEYCVINGDPDSVVAGLVADHDISAGIVCVPDELHYDYARALISREVHTLVVKPLTTDVTEAKRLIELQEKKNIWAAVEYHKRFDEANQYVKKIYRQGQLGKISYVTVDYSQKIEIPSVILSSWVERSNPFQYLGSHYVDLVYYITGYLPVAVTAMGTKGVLTSLGVNAFDAVHASVLWENPSNKADQFVTNFNTNWIDPNTTSALSDQKYKIIGSRGRIELDQKCRGIQIVNDSEGVRDINPYFSEFVDEFTGRYRFAGYGYRSIFQFFQDVIRFKAGQITLDELSVARPGFRNSLVSVAVVDAANQSLANGFDWVKIDSRELMVFCLAEDGAAINI